MGIDVKLLSDAKYSAEDVATIVKSMPEVTEFKIRVNDWATDYVIFNFKFNEEQRQMNIHSHVNDYGIQCLLCSLGQWGSATEILTRIGNIIGGFFTENDCDEKYVRLNGMLNENDGIPYLLKQAMLSGKMSDNDDIDGLVSFINEWNENHKR